jgi:hypothetical protein
MPYPFCMGIRHLKFSRLYPRDSQRISCLRAQPLGARSLPASFYQTF